MNLPANIHDPSLREHEPLRSHITMLECAKGLRSSAKDTVSAFVKAMQRDDQAAAAAKEWAHLVFRGVISGQSTLELTDNGEELYKVFLDYQYRLHVEGQDGALKCSAHVRRCGIRALKAIEINGRGKGTQHSTQGRGNQGGRNDLHNQRASRSSGPKEAKRLANPGTHNSDAGLARAPMMPPAHPELTATGSNIERGSLCGPTVQQGDPPPAAGARLSVPPEVAKPSKRSTSKKDKKRKASSQKPPVVTPSDGSEDDKEPSTTHAVTAASSTSHRSKRITSNPSCQSRDPIEVANQADEISSAHSAETHKQHHQGTTSISQTQSPPTIPFGDLASHPSSRGRRGAPSPLSVRKHVRHRFSSVPTRLTRGDSNSRRLRKIKQVRDLQTRPNKRLRRASLSTLDSPLGEGSKSTPDLPAKFLQEPTTRGRLFTGNIHVESKARKKRSRLQFETAFVAFEENLSPNSHKVLGPDDRPLRPLPKKIRHVRSVQVVPAVSSRAPSLEHVDQLLRDVASNELTILREGVGPELPDWTQNKEHDAEYDDLDGDDQDEANDVQVTTATSAPSKPPVPAPPRIWAESRQEVCESFEYFRCYHGGVYSKDDIVKGYLLGAYSANRDIFQHDGKLIISHGGGKSESILETRRGPKRYQTDQDQEASDKSVRALLKTWKDRRPIVLLADDKYTLFPYDLTSAKYTYVVLGLYWISHAWAECQSTRDGSGRVVRWKFAFQWCEGQGDPWWLPQQETKNTTSDPLKSMSSLRMRSTKGSSRAENTSGDPSIQCDHCQEQSPFVYKQGWMCLNPRCDVFWNIDGEDPKQLDYCEEFLGLLPQNFERLPNITPKRVMETPGGVTTTYVCSKGWHCTNCGRLSCRYKWEHWECSNCKFTHVVSGRVRSPKEFWHQRPSKGFLHSQTGKDSGILACRLEPIDLGGDKGFTSRLTFILPHGRGKIHLILGTPLSNGDANDIFRLYQHQSSTGELKLRRYPLRNHKARGLLLTNYFSQNSGEPYQYVGGSGQTVPFCEAPECVQRALALIKERSSIALHTDIPFNEILSAAYMERQKMSFHSDSEKGLGPIVASLSLGSAALMHFRLHVNAENPKPKSPYALTLVLRHGDVLIMEGDGVQKYYEHTVVPMNFRIAATARCIGSA